MKAFLMGSVRRAVHGRLASADMIIWDTNADGRIDAGEFAAGMEANATFDAWDADGDGMVTRDEYVAANWLRFDADADGFWSQDELGAWEEDEMRMTPRAAAVKSASRTGRTPARQPARQAMPGPIAGPVVPGARVLPRSEPPRPMTRRCRIILANGPLRRPVLLGGIADGGDARTGAEHGPAARMGAAGPSASERYPQEARR